MGKKGFSLVEVLVATAITGVGITAALGGMRSLLRGDYHARQVEIMQRLAIQKFDEVIATDEITSAPLSGNFDDVNVEGYTYRVEVEPTPTENLEVVIVTVQRTDNEQLQTTTSGLHFTPPEQTEGAQ